MCVPNVPTTTSDAGLSLPDVGFIIKLHPSEHSELWDTLRHGCPEANLRVIKRCGTAEFLACADLVLTRFSTTGMEAVVLSKPLVTINLTDRPARASYATSGVALAVRATLRVANRS